MITVRKSAARGRSSHGWLDSRHTFSFAGYHDPAHMGFGPLRVINEDRVAPGAGFPPHAHQDMEILSYVLAGALEHQDSLGSGSVIRPGDVQRMSAGTGIRHSEFNASKTAPVHFLQIWILPQHTGIAPGYEQKHFANDGSEGLRLVASGDARDGALTIHQDADVYAGRLAPEDTVNHGLSPRRLGWVQVARGTLTVNGLSFSTGDGAAVEDETELALRAESDVELLLFDMAR